MVNVTLGSHMKRKHRYALLPSPMLTDGVVMSRLAARTKQRFDVWSIFVRKPLAFRAKLDRKSLNETWVIFSK